MEFKGYERADGSVGIRNKILVIAVDECCEGIARSIAREDADSVVVTNWYTCMLGGNEETFHQLTALGKNPNAAGAVVVSMGCGSILTSQIAEPIKALGKPVFELTCQQEGGTRKTIAKGTEYIKQIRRHIDSLKRKPFPLSKLVVGVKCGGSDTSSGLASNPAVGLAVDKMVDAGASCIGGELFELIGCEHKLLERAVSESVKQRILGLIDNEKRRWGVEGSGVETMSIGNCVGGLTTIEEKSLGALYKMGSKPIQGVLQINRYGVEKIARPGFYLSETTMLCGGAGVNFASLGAQLILWTSGAAGYECPLLPVIRVSGNTQLFNEDMDVDARGILLGTSGLSAVAGDIFRKICSVADGERTAIEGIGCSTMTLYQKDVRLENLLKLPCYKQ